MTKIVLMKVFNPKHARVFKDMGTGEKMYLVYEGDCTDFHGDMSYSVEEYRQWLKDTDSLNHAQASFVFGSKMEEDCLPPYWCDDWEEAMRKYNIIKG